jgi:FkbM family methyltransferase
MKTLLKSLVKKSVRRAVVVIEKKFGVNISRYPLEKFYSDFIELVNLDLISQSRGVLHIGAHVGLESRSYFDKQKSVIFIEADPKTFLVLEKNIAPFRNQKAFNWLLGDEEKIVNFHIANNQSESSSIFPFSRENQIQNLSASEVTPIPMSRLDSKFTFEDLENYDHWVIDVQGAELKVLEGAGQLLNLCKTIFIECSLKEFYEGGAMWNEIHEFLSRKGFKYFVLPPNISHLNVVFFRQYE